MRKRVWTTYLPHISLSMSSIKKIQFCNFGIVLVDIRYIIITDTIFSSKHWICLMITPKLSNVLVLDSLDNDSKCYRDLLATIQT